MYADINQLEVPVNAMHDLCDFFMGEYLKFYLNFSYLKTKEKPRRNTSSFLTFKS